MQGDAAGDVQQGEVVKTHDLGRYHRDLSIWRTLRWFVGVVGERTGKPGATPSPSGAITG
ncbi:hypothetical protein GCM10018953_66510 [Streptosporangium nondiastaticum]